MQMKYFRAEHDFSLYVTVYKGPRFEATVIVRSIAIGETISEMLIVVVFANMAYVIECLKCNKKHYAGETAGETENALHIRMNGLWSDIKQRRLDKPVANHFNPEGHSPEDLSIFVIEQIHWEEVNFRKVKESYWIQTLRLLVPEGVNKPQSVDHRNDGLIDTVLHHNFGVLTLARIFLVASGYHPDEGSDRAKRSVKGNSPDQKKEEKNILELLHSPV